MKTFYLFLRLLGLFLNFLGATWILLCGILTHSLITIVAAVVWGIIIYFGYFKQK